jgi:hypothetical protein
MVFRVLRLSVIARLNLAVFCLCWGLSGIPAFGLVDALLTFMNYIVPAYYS